MFRFFQRGTPPKADTAAFAFSMDFLPGTKLAGRFRIIQAFEGGLGVVCFVEDEQHSPDRGQSRFVLKFPKLLHPSHEAAFRREASVWVLLGRHPAIVPAFWVDVVGSRLCVAAEFIPPDALGRTTLRDHLVSQPRPLRQVCRWAFQFLQAMQHARAQGLASHGDIKPENLLIDPNGDLQITDFGLARALHADGFAQGGTPAYMPPEQWRGEVLDLRSDLYAFGLVLFELCFGRSAFDVRTVAGLRDVHLAGKLSVPPHPLAGLISALVRSDRSLRPDLDMALVHLRDLAREAGVSLPVPLPPTEVDRRAELLAQTSVEGPQGVGSALQAAVELTRLWPDDASGWTQLGRLYLSAGDFRRAHAATVRSIELDDTRSAPWNNLGLVWGKLGEPSKAVLSFRRALDCNPDNTGAMLNMSKPLMDLGQQDEAVALLQGAVTLAPDKYAAWVNLGGCLWRTGQKMAALEALRRGSDLAPPSAKAALLQQLRDWERSVA
jgi:serine/threonine protein kinase